MEIEEILRKKREQMAEAAKALGLNLIDVRIAVPEDGPLHIVAAYQVEPGRLMDAPADDQQDDYDKKFEKMMLDQRAAETDQQFSEAEEAARRLFKKLGGDDA